MAFYLSGMLSRLWRPTIYGLASRGPETEMQTRGYAARKGTREKALKKKQAQKLKKAAMQARKQKHEIKRSSDSSIKKTEDLLLPPPPTQYNVYFANLYKPVEFSVIEAINFHKEDHHSTVLAQNNAVIDILIELDMTAEKKNRALRPWSDVVVYPVPFSMGIKKKILVICPEDQKIKALQAGADFAGGNALMRDIKKGTFNAAQFDSIIGSISLHDEINSIRAHLKLLHPRVTNGTLTNDIISAIQKIKFGMEYTSRLSGREDKFGWIKFNIGKIDMNPHDVERNFITLLRSVEERRPKREGDFITHVYSMSLPSREKVKINFRSYLEDTKSNSAQFK